MNSPSRPEIALVGAGIGGGFNHTDQLIARTYNETIIKEELGDVEEWADAVDDEHDRMINNLVWEPVLREDYPNEKTITTTWANKLKSNGTKRGRCNVRGFEQEPDVHYNADEKAAPVANMTSIRIVLTLVIACILWKMRLLDVKGAFLKGKFEARDKPMALEVPQGFLWVYLILGEEMKARKDLGRAMSQDEVRRRLIELQEIWKRKPVAERVKLLKEQKNPRGGVRRIILRLLRTLYGTVQAARAFWREMLKAFRTMSYNRCDADPCLYYRWDSEERLALWLSWIDDCLIVGENQLVDQECERMMEMFDCDDVGSAHEYVGTKLDQGRLGNDSHTAGLAAEFSR